MSNQMKLQPHDGMKSEFGFMSLFRHAATLLVAIGLAACVGQTDVSNAGFPERFSLKLYRSTSDQQYTYFTVNRTGELSYASGQAAMLGLAEPVTVLKEEQGRGLWDLIRRHELLKAPHQPFRKAEVIEYRMSIQTRSHRRNVRIVDNRAADITEVHNFLFDIIKSAHYRNVESK